MTTLLLSRARITTCILINLCATPGLGSIFARRIIVGIFQLILALIGFCLIVGWMFEAMATAISQEINGQGRANAPDWMWRCGLIFFGTAWLWSLLTSINLWRQAKFESAPPKLSDLPKT